MRTDTATVDTTDDPMPDTQASTGPRLAEHFAHLALAALEESPLNPRQTFDAQALADLTASVREKGIVEPIVVRPRGHGSDFEIVCGARRVRAARGAGLTTVPAIVRGYTDVQVLEIMAIENGQRDDVVPLEEAAGYRNLLLVSTSYTPAVLAAKIGRSEQYVWNRLRLLELVPEIQELLTTGEIGVEHAEVIAKLKPAEQRSLLVKRGFHQESGLFTFDGALAFDDNPERRAKRKPVSVRQLKQYIAEHIRLDLAHAAIAAPLEFGETARRVDEALAEPGRGRKVIPITFSHVCPGGAKDPHERTYGATAWKKAQNAAGEATCDHAVLGLVVAGEHYGESFRVCIARDRCRTHWADTVKAKEKAAKLREQGKGKQAAKVEKRAEDSWETRQRQRQAETKARETAWQAIAKPVLIDAVAQVKGIKVLTPKLAAALLEASDGVLDGPLVKTHLGATWWKTPVAALLVSQVGVYHYSGYDNKLSGFDEYVKAVAKPFGLDIRRLEAVRDKHQPAAGGPTAKKSAAGKKGAA